MRLEHAAMYVADLEAATDFFVRCLGARAGSLYRNQSTGFRSCFLSFDGGARLELMQKPDAPARPGFGHIAFSLGSREAVDSLTGHLQKDGYRVISGPRVTGDGYYESCIEVFDGHCIELTI